MFQEVALSFELVLESLGEIADVFHGGRGGTVLLHRVGEFVAFGQAARKEARLTHIEVEALQAAVTHADDRVLLARVAFGLVFCCFGCR